ncbi:hypothetical protein [Motiliproteus sp. SC1-56]|uniref:hypothetical protein n=1 Tax=Motiliproteus sp. SC1-56 TaxID=2799565 RepID=UPI001A8E554F|nr:hypothetical protein [Motiliproteus sp. SC1-56]
MILPVPQPTAAAVFLLWLCALWGTAVQGAERLELVQALPIVPAAHDTVPLEPSGLAVCGDRLLMVSDDHDDRVFELLPGPRQARARVFIEIKVGAPPTLPNYTSRRLRRLAAKGRWDWEGIACEAGELFLLSETLAQVLAVDSQGLGTWMGTSLYRAGRDIGLFALPNAFAEGLTLTPSQAFVAGERQPRGLVIAERGRRPWPRARALWLTPFPDLMSPHDFSGLWAETDTLYTLERNHYQVCRRPPPDFKANRCWGYRHVEQAPDLAYRDQRFGKAEGIARRGDLLYLVLDNNHGPRAADPEDRRPWLFVFSVPADW